MELPDEQRAILSATQSGLRQEVSVFKHLHGFVVTKRGIINLTWYIAWFTAAPSAGKNSLNDKVSLSYNRKLF